MIKIALLAVLLSGCASIDKSITIYDSQDIDLNYFTTSDTNTDADGKLTITPIP